MDDVAQKALQVAIMIWSRRWHMLYAAIGICALGWIGVFVTPSRYQASARIYVDTDTLLAPLLRGMTVDVNMSQQVEMMQRTLLSRPNLESVMRMADLDLRVNSPQQREDLLKSLGARISVRSEGRNLFTVNFIDPDRDMAKDVVQALLTIFVESNLGNTRQDIQKARQFIDDQIAQYENQLREMEARMVEFKREHPGMLAQSGTVAVRLDQARERIVQVKADLDDAIAQRDAIAKEMRSVPQFLEVDGPQIIVDGRGPRGAAGTLDQQIVEANQHLNTLRLKYTDQHPDVQEALHVLNNLQEQRANLSSTGGDRTRYSRIANPLFDQFRLKLVDAESRVNTLQRRYEGQQAEMARLEELAQSSPEIEAQAIGLDRDYQVIKKSYDDLLTRRESAKLSQDVDIKAEKVQFRIVDPPTVPMRPNFPSRPLMVSAVLLAALMGGLVVAFAQARLSDSFSTPQRMREALRMNVIGSVSLVDLPSRAREQHREVMLFTAGLCAIALVYGIIMAALFLQPLPSDVAFRQDTNKMSASVSSVAVPSRALALIQRGNS